jgi:hypothetical protein
VKQLEVLGQLMEGGEVSLASWLGAPVDRARAEALLSRVEQRLRQRRVAGAQRFHLRLAELICRYWAGKDTDAVYETMSALLTDARERALLELCCGQLLMARRCQPAWRHLDRGFQLAANLLEAEDYFRVLKRHELLRQLPLATTPADAAPLATLLNEARVIARLRGRGGHTAPAAGRHRDTTG